MIKNRKVKVRTPKRKFQIPKTLIKWTQQAKDCYERKCICSGCLINSVLETECVMKYVIPKICKKYGNPPKNLEDAQENTDLEKV